LSSSIYHQQGVHYLLYKVSESRPAASSTRRVSGRAGAAGAVPAPRLQVTRPARRTGPPFLLVTRPARPTGPPRRVGADRPAALVTQDQILLRRPVLYKRAEWWNIVGPHYDGRRLGRPPRGSPQILLSPASIMSPHGSGQWRPAQTPSEPPLIVSPCDGW
jgi:hypothetical protein